MEKQIYLDYNASTPIASEVAEAMRPFLCENYGNPSSQHWAGIPAKEAVECARGTLRLSTGRMTTPDDISTAVGIITETAERLRNG